MVPSSISVRGGASVPLTVFALRKDGFAGPITISLKDAPAGFLLGGTAVPAGQDQVRLTLTAPPNPAAEPLSLSVQGSATVDGQPITHLAIPADDMMQAFLYRHLVPAQDLKVSVAGRMMAKIAMRILSPTPVQIPAGGSARVRVAQSTSTFFAKYHFELSDAPEGISIKGVAPVRDGTEITLQCDSAKVKPGLKGNLILEIFAERPAAAAGKAQPSRRPPLSALPAIPFEITAP